MDLSHPTSPTWQKSLQSSSMSHPARRPAYILLTNTMWPALPHSPADFPVQPAPLGRSLSKAAPEASHSLVSPSSAQQHSKVTPLREVIRPVLLRSRGEDNHTQQSHCSPSSGLGSDIQSDCQSHPPTKTSQGAAQREIAVTTATLQLTATTATHYNPKRWTGVDTWSDCRPCPPVKAFQENNSGRHTAVKCDCSPGKWAEERHLVWQNYKPSVAPDWPLNDAVTRHRLQ